MFQQTYPLPAEVTIEVAKWRRGRLLDENGCYCALGALMLAAGVPAYALRDSASHETVAVQGFVLNCRQDSLGHIIGANDPLYSSDSARRSALRRAFARLDVKLLFSDEEASST